MNASIPRAWPRFASKHLRVLPALLLASVVVAGCTSSGDAVAPLAIAQDSICAVDGMLLVDYPGPKAQIHYDQGPPEFFCDTLDMMAMMLRPEQKKRVVAVFTQDMGATEWAHPEGHWIEARAAFYVAGSTRKGSMGPTLASFAREADAREFAARYHGQVLRYGEITMETVSTRGGAMQGQATALAP